MTFPDHLNRALQRLGSALDNLEAAAARRARVDAARVDMDHEFAVMQDDRSRLAVELDSALARSKTLNHANEEVAQRLARTSATVRMILAEITAPAEPT